MSKMRNFIFGAALLALPVATPVVYAAATLDDLLESVRTVRAHEEQAFKERSSAFNAAAPAQQDQMLKEALAKKQALASTSDSLSAQFSANELKINEMKKTLRDKATALGLSEIFGLSRQVAGDAATVLRQSLISTEYPAKPGEQSRDEFLRAYSTSQSTPTAAELERVWFEIQREMTASGKVAKYKGAVVQPSGEAVEAEVVRIGPFTASSDGKFLSYVPSLNALNVYPRQPPEEFLATLNNLQSASSGYVGAVVDSARGVLMSLYVDRPTWAHRIEMGEEVGYIILAVGLAGLVAFIFQLVYLLMVRAGVSRQLKHLEKPTADNALGRVLLAFKGDGKQIEQDADIAELRISEAVLREVPKLERFQAFLRLAVAAGPLLGLIGTVLGMIITFQSITESGSSDPKLMATGIGQAMIATVLGLGIAIPLLFANALLSSLSRGVSQILDEQAVGMLAESIEKQRRG